MNKDHKDISEYYETHPASVSSPFGGIGTDGKHNAYLSEVMTALKTGISGADVLDVGCGSGWFARYCSGKVKSYTGMDITSSCARMTKNVVPHVIVGTAESLPFEDASFDRVFYIDSFEHVPDQIKAAAEAFRVLKPGGKVFLSVPNYSNVCGLVKFFGEGVGLYKKNSWAPFDKWVPQVLEHFMTPSKVKKAFSAGGFTKFRMAGGRRDFIDGVFPWIDHKCMPAERYVRKIFSFVERPLAALLPWLSLHNFWVIEK